MAIEWSQFEAALNVVNGISLGLSIIGFSLFLGLLLSQRKVVNRVSFRIAGVLLLINVVHHITEILCRLWRERSSLCMIIGWFNMFTASLLILLGTLVAYNLLYVYIGRQKVTKLREAGYYASTLLASILISLPGIFLHRFGFDATSQICGYLSGGDSMGKLVDWFTLFGWLTFGVAFALTVILRVRLDIRKKRIYSHRSEAQFQDLVQRVSYYPLLTALIGLVRCIIGSNRQMPAALRQLSYLIFSIQGILYLILFLLDPDTKIAIKQIQEMIVYKYEFRREIHPQANHRSWFHHRLRKLLKPMLSNTEELYIYSIQHGTYLANRENTDSIKQSPTVPANVFYTSSSYSLGHQSVDSLLGLPRISKVVSKPQDDELFRMI